MGKGGGYLMTVSQAKELFRQLVKEHFANSTVIFDRQSRVPKPDLPLVTIAPGNVKRHRAANEILDLPEREGYIHSKISFVIDLFSHGAPVYDDDTRMEIAREDTATDEMSQFVNFLDSEYVTLWSNRNDVAVQVEGDVQNLTGAVNDTTYEFRSRLSVNFYFTQKTVGDKATPAFS